MADDWRTPDTDALVDAILRLDEPRRRRSDSCATCARSASSTTWRQRWAVVRLLDDGLHYAEISKRTGREHRDDHPDRIVAQPRRGRLPATCSSS